MSKNKTPCPTGDTAEQSKDGKPDETISNVHSTSGGASRQGRIFSLLLRGQENAVGLRDLANMTGLSEREVRQTIQKERFNGAPILSDNFSGYFLPGNDAEIARCVRSLRHRAKEVYRVADAIEKAGAGYGG